MKLVSLTDFSMHMNLHHPMEAIVATSLLNARDLYSLLRHRSRKRDESSRYE
jgi:hypothetical protein